jgi:hypothetical protein
MTRIVLYLPDIVLASPKTTARIVPYFAGAVQATEIAHAGVIADGAGQAFASVVPGAGPFANLRLLGERGWRLGCGEAIDRDREQAESQKENRDRSSSEHARLLLARTPAAQVGCV